MRNILYLKPEHKLGTKMNREQFREAHSAVRAHARENAPKPFNRNRMQNALRYSKLLEIPGKGIIKITAARGGYYPVKDTTAEIIHAVITDRPLRQRIAEVLKWAAHYREGARSDSLASSRNHARRAARNCCREARELRADLTRLPG